MNIYFIKNQKKNYIKNIRNGKITITEKKEKSKNYKNEEKIINVIEKIAERYPAPEYVFCYE